MPGIFSGKMKREQLIMKRNAKRDAYAGDGWNHQSQRKPGVEGAKVVTTTLGADKFGVRSMFVQEGDEAVEKRRQEAFAQLKYRFFEQLPKQAAKSHVTGAVPAEHWLHPELPPQCDASTGGRRRIPLAIELPTPNWKPPHKKEEELKEEGVEASSPGSDDEDATEIDEVKKVPSKKQTPAAVIIKKDDGDDDAALVRPKGDSDDDDNDEPIDYKTVDEAERAAFARWESHMSSYGTSDLSNKKEETNQYEVNLDVWRQLWRTVHLSNVVLLLCDVRFPMLQLPFSVVKYVMLDCRRPMVIVLNKVDVVPKETVDGWKVFLKKHFSRLLDEQLALEASQAEKADDDDAAPQPVKRNLKQLPRDAEGNWLLSVAEFTCVPVRNTGVLVQPAEQQPKKTNKNKGPTARRGKRNANQAMRRVMEVSKTASLSGYKIPGASSSSDDSSSSSDDSSSDEEDSRYRMNNFKGSEKIRKEEKEEQEEKEHREDDYVVRQLRNIVGMCVELHAKNVTTSSPTSAASPVTTSTPGSAITIGMCGQPNVGKSSLMNCLLGEKHVSVSSSAGHTKHLQTITVDMPRLAPDATQHRDPTTAAAMAQANQTKKMTIVDCPGIVWPMIGLPRPLQAIIGSHQIAQSRDPQSSIRYVACCVPLEGPKIYRLTRYDDSYVQEDDNWSSFEICEAFAHKRGYHQSHGKLDIHRGAIEILSEVQEGRVPLFHTPPTSGARPFKLHEALIH